ncbi:AfsA-related hotdog domain-containing protein [Streptomyces sp. NPDC051940]|uniref:AfsA-related hotdog domain-containing protein n=1 Tax=Streptomyces sp. NPDC051940 TaxID=3155675 RepID=UPI00344217AB
MTVENGPASIRTVPGSAVTGTSHLIHRAPVGDRYFLQAPSLGEENFSLAAELPVDHPLFNDNSGVFHDMLVATETIREVGEFIGHRYFSIPEDRPGLFYQFTLTVTDASAWRADPVRDADPVPLTSHIRARPANVVNDVPRGLDFQLDVSVADARCAEGTARLVFLNSNVHRKHVEHTRRATLSTPELDDSPDGPLVPVDPAETGRRSARNVVISEPMRAAQGWLTSWLLTENVDPVFDTASGQLTALHLLEALRQSSLVAAGRAHGLRAESSTLGSIQVHFRGQAELDLPLRCVAVAGPLGHDAEGRSSVPVTLTVTQRRRSVAEARTVVIQDH